VRRDLLRPVAQNPEPPQQQSQEEECEDMASKWPGIVVRCNKGEKGDVPRVASATSPDIIIAGRQPLPDPGMLTNPANYENSYDNPLYIGFPNYLYVRGRNFTAGELQGTWNLFFSAPEILLWPSLWQNNQLATSSGERNPSFKLKAGEIGASTDSFVWIPPDTSGQYCFIAVASTPGHGNPLAGVKSITELASTLSNNANIAQRNVTVVRGNLPEFTVQLGYDQGSEGCRIDLAFVFENIPKGSSYSIASGTPLHGKSLYHSDSNTRDNTFKFTWTDLDIPAGWKTNFDVTIRFGRDWSGIPPGQYPRITVRGELVQHSSDRLYHLGHDAGVDPATKKARVDRSGGPVRVIVVGSWTALFPDVGPKG
jgi:hypothetical protein